MPLVTFAQALDLLKNGQVVAIPTETVYGLAAIADNLDAVAKIYHIKQRPREHPLIVHVAKDAALENWVRTIAPAAQRLIDSFWPGALTLLFERKACVFEACVAGQDTLALRCPAHPLTMRLLNALGPHAALAAPSANRFTAVSPTTAQHVLDDYDGEVAVLDGGACSAGIESTIVDVRFERIKILRHGAIAQQELESEIEFYASNQDPNQVTDQNSTQAKPPLVSGSHAKHYAPKTALRLVERSWMTEQLANLAMQGIALISYRPELLGYANVFVLSADPKQYASQLYAQLRWLDKQRFTQIWVEQVPTTQAWLAIEDRLQRASFRG